MFLKLSILLVLFFQTISNSPLPKKKSKIQESESGLESWDTSRSENPEELGSYFEGDIVTDKLGRNGVVDSTLRWENGMIPYEINGDFSGKEKNLILKAIDMYNKYTCVRPRTQKDKDFVSITNYKSGCWSKVGRNGKKQEVNLQSPQCTTQLGTAIHELMHATGFLHEQNRFERDDFITIKWKNIKNGREGNFVKAEEGTEKGYGVPYDFSSVMHYSSTAFSSNGERTIIPKNGDDLKNMGQRRGFSGGDIMKINAMYGCPEKTEKLNITSETFPSESNTPTDKEREPNSIWEAVTSLFSIFDEK